MKRQWPHPDFKNEDYIENTQSIFEKWLQENLTEQELDRVAPKLPCPHENVSMIENVSMFGISNGFKCLDCGAKMKPASWVAI
jgi:hypothetical protein